MSTYDYSDLNNTRPTQRVANARARRVSKVYKDTETNTDPNYKEPQSQLPPSNGVTVTPDVIDELTKAIHHLQQVVLKLRGGV